MIVKRRTSGFIVEPEDLPVHKVEILERLIWQALLILFWNMIKIMTRVLLLIGTKRKNLINNCFCVSEAARHWSTKKTL